MRTNQKTPLHVMFTMDCAPPGGAEAVPGPKSWEDAERAINSFAEGLAQLEMKGTFFLVPSILKRLDETVDCLESAGMEPAVLCHPQLHEYQSHLGSYSFDRQREIVHLVTDIWTQRRQEEPKTFRPGFFSANDYTYQVLCLEGYRQGSCSLPGRIDMEQCCKWDGAFPFAHHTDPLDRKLAGTMEFYEVPVTSDFESRGAPGSEIYTPPHLRIESPCINEHAGKLIRGTLGRMEEEETSARSLLFVTHNAVSWGAPEDPHLDRLQNLVSLLRETVQGRHLKLTPNTVGSVHDYADSVWNGDETLGEL